MKRGFISAILATIICFSIAGCSGTTSESPSTEANSAEHVAVEIKQSPDKYTWYIKDYVGMNAASVGYEAIDGFRYDRYGSGVVKVVFVASDGTYIDPGNEEQLKEYKVVGQNIDPNTEMKYVFELDSNGEEYENLVNSKTYDEIVLAVDKVGSNGSGPELTVIQGSPEKYKQYVRDYVGRNLAECGYCSISGNLTDQYGHGYVTFDIVADDGSYIDPENKEQLAGYMVTAQSVEPNTEITMTYMTDSDGKEYSNLVANMNLDSITLTVTKAPESGYPITTEEN